MKNLSNVESNYTSTKLASRWALSVGSLYSRYESTKLSYDICQLSWLGERPINSFHPLSAMVCCFFASFPGFLRLNHINRNKPLLSPGSPKLRGTFEQPLATISAKTRAQEIVSSIRYAIPFLGAICREDAVLAIPCRELVRSMVLFRACSDLL